MFTSEDWRCDYCHDQMDRRFRKSHEPTCANMAADETVWMDQLLAELGIGETETKA